MGRRLYQSCVELDETSGLPADYTSLFASYDNLVRSLARKAHIPEDFVEESVQEVQAKFFAKNGLDMFDPTVGTRFATMYRKWCAMFLMQERDKAVRYHSRFIPKLETERLADATGYEPDIADELTSEGAVAEWLARAEALLVEKDAANLVPLLHLCAHAAQVNSRLSSKQIAEAAGVTEKQAHNTLLKMRRILTKAGLGPETIGQL